MNREEIHAQSRKQKDARKVVQRILQSYFAALFEESQAAAEALLNRAIELFDQQRQASGEEPVPVTR